MLADEAVFVNEDMDAELAAVDVVTIEDDVAVVLAEGVELLVDDIAGPDFVLVRKITPAAAMMMITITITATTIREIARKFFLITVPDIYWHGLN